jgi:hypothetical protein
MSDLLETLLDWAVGQLARPGHRRSRVSDVIGLREGRSPWLVRLADGTAAVLRVGDVADGQQRDGFRIEAAVLETAREHGIPTSELVAHDLTGEHTGALAVLSTVIEGSSRIPAVPTPGRLREYGAATATLHRVPGAALGPMPRRTRPISLVDFAAHRPARRSTRPPRPRAYRTAPIGPPTGATPTGATPAAGTVAGSIGCRNRPPAWRLRGVARGSG